MQDKIWYKSASLQGNIVVVLGMLIKWLGLPVLQDEVTAIVSALFVLIGVGYAIWGRVKTKGEPIGWRIK